MEPIPESEAQIHFFKLLEMLSHHNSVLSTQVHLRPPPSILHGFQLPGLVLMHVVRSRLQFHSISSLESALPALHIYTPHEKRDFPLYIVKTNSRKLLIRSLSDLKLLVPQLVSEGSKG